MSSSTLRGIFPEPKPVNRRNFIRENVKSVRQMQKLLQEAGAIKPRCSNDKYNTVPPFSKPADYVPVQRGLSKESKFSSNRNISKKAKEPILHPDEQKVSHRSVQTERLDNDPSKVFETGVIKYPTAGLKRLNITSKTPHRFEQGDTPEVIQNTEMDEKNYIQENKTNFKPKLPKETAVKVPAQAPPTYQRGVVPKYLKNRREEKEEEVDDNCPPGHILLPEEERKETLRVLRQSYADRIQELNSLPVRSDTLRVKKRKIDIEEELKRIDGGIKVTTIFCSMVNSAMAKIPSKCEGGRGLKYLWGDALLDSPDCVGPNNMPYPNAAIDRSFRGSNPWTGSSRTGRSQRTIDPFITRKALLAAHQQSLEESPTISRQARAANASPSNACGATPSRLCKTRYNTTAPMYGVSLTSGQPVTIVQKFPDLLQQVVFEVCESTECDVVRGECTQTYVPYLFLVIPLGPVTLTGQDYVLVESGCVCRPKYSAQTSQEASALSSIPRL